jgi:hypothetical protein
MGLYAMRTGARISPFALDLCWEEGTLGALFFDPASRYRERLAIEAPWSTEYVDSPFRPRTRASSAAGAGPP